MTKYGRDYFEWQRRIGEFGGQANAFKFIHHCNEGLVTLDFGCGGGYLLANLPAKRRIGVEVNEFAREMATANGIEVFDSAEALEDGSVDLIVSNHALEHCRYPLGELKALYQKLADGGTAVFAVPCETVKNFYKEDDVNQHLYSWSPQALGNLFQEAGFFVLKSEPLLHKWPPKYRKIVKALGWPAFHRICRMYARISTDVSQVICVAQKRS